MKKFQCVECGHEYNERNIPSSWVCNQAQCPGGGLTGLIIEVEDHGEQQDPHGQQDPGKPVELDRQAGLCVLLMDASGSMANPVFSDSPMPSRYGGGHKSKREIIADVAAQAIFDLSLMMEKDNAYICAIKFDHTRSVMFTKSVASIIQEFGTAQALADYFYKELSMMNGGTDINSALKMAYSFCQKFCNSDIAAMGNFSPIVHRVNAPYLNQNLNIPNVRTLIYTDGEQSGEFGRIENPFRNEVPDLLMGAYIGQQNEPGCADLRNIISKCPIHGTEQFFVLDRPDKIARLRGLFRMASGTSGFCPSCLGSDTQR